MRSISITYETYDEPPQTVTETLWFHLNHPELVEMEAESKAGMTGRMKQLIDSGNEKGFALEFNKLVLAAFGIRSEDGRRFQKSDEIRKEFKESAAYDALYMKFMNEEGFADRFIREIFPKDVQVSIEQAELTPEGQALLQRVTPPPEAT